MCGGTCCSAFRGAERPGLSPRVRGNPKPTITSKTNTGSIPACAGEPAAAAAPIAGRSVYPRVCGGTSSEPWACKAVTGLSPRVRGNHIVPPPLRSLRRSIPACAGEPPQPPRRLPRQTVYPRVCGGTTKDTSTLSQAQGLSPRVRGNQLESYHSVVDVRSIPACAGEPESHTSYGYEVSVYPRVCGGTAAACALAATEYGLSPRVRGNRLLVKCLLMRLRSIPACAGEPARRWDAGL